MDSVYTSPLIDAMTPNIPGPPQAMQDLACAICALKDQRERRAGPSICLADLASPHVQMC